MQTGERLGVSRPLLTGDVVGVSNESIIVSPTSSPTAFHTCSSGTFARGKYKQPVRIK